MRFLSAKQVFNGEVFLPDNSVLVLDEKKTLIEITTREKVSEYRVEVFDGIITPGFINAHCHLELSHLKNIIPQHTGLPNFARHIITRRDNFKEEHIIAAANDADKEMQTNGIVAVGDISNTEISFSVKQKSFIHYHTFIELIGLQPLQAETIFEKGISLLHKLSGFNLKGSIAPHAPYSTSNTLIKQIADFNHDNNLPFSIHNQESEDEKLFFMGEPNNFNDLYRFLNINTDWFKAPKTSSLKNYGSFLNKNSSLLVHNTFSEKEDLEFVKMKNIFWCFCPNANLYIEGCLPNYTLFEGMKEKICVGTDSLASNSQLNLIHELNILLQNTKVFSIPELLRAITFNGAKALGIDEAYGKLIVGKNAGLNLIKNNVSEIVFVKKIA